MFNAGRFRIHHRGMLVVAAVSLFLLVGLVGVVLVNGSPSSSLPASNAASKCQTPTGPTARGYGETGTGVTPADPDCDAACGPAAADGPTARGYGESGAASVAPTCGPCPTAPPGATGRGYGESGVGGVLSDECDSDDASSHRDEATVAPAANGGNGPTSAVGATTRAPLTGGGGTHGGEVPGATGRAAPRPVDAADHGGVAGQPLSTPLSAAVVAQAPSVEGDRKNTALVVGGLALLLVAVAVVLRRGRPGTAW